MDTLLLVGNLLTLFLAKSMDGKLTLDEVSECLKTVFPDHFTDVHEEITDALEDGKITALEALRITMAVIT